MHDDDQICILDVFPGLDSTRVYVVSKWLIACVTQDHDKSNFLGLCGDSASTLTRDIDIENLSVCPPVCLSVSLSVTSFRD